MPRALRNTQSYPQNCVYNAAVHTVKTSVNKKQLHLLKNADKDGISDEARGISTMVDHIPRDHGADGMLEWWWSEERFRLPTDASVSAKLRALMYPAITSAASATWNPSTQFLTALKARLETSQEAATLRTMSSKVAKNTTSDPP